MVSAFVVVQVLKQHGPLEVQAIATKLGDQVGYQDVASALAEASRNGQAELDAGRHRWKAT